MSESALDLRRGELAVVVPLVGLLLVLSAWPAAISGRSFGGGQAAVVVAAGVDLAPGCSVADYTSPSTKPPPNARLAACVTFRVSAAPQQPPGAAPAKGEK